MFRSTIGVFLLFTFIYALTMSGHIYSPDEELMFRTAQSLATRGALDIEPIAKGFASRKGVNGKEYAQYGVGNSLLAVPLYCAGELATKIISDKTAAKWLDFKTVNYIPAQANRGVALLERLWVVKLGILLGAATCALIWRFVFLLYARGAPGARRAAWLVALAYGLGTIALPYARTYYSEPTATFFSLLAFYWIGVRRRPGRRRILAAGLAFAFALLTRIDSVVLLPALGLLLAFRILENEECDMSSALHETADQIMKKVFAKESLWDYALLLAPVGAFGIFYLGLNRLHFGGMAQSAYADQIEGIHFSTPLLAGLYGFFFSIGKSDFLFSPAIVLGLAGFRSFTRRNMAVGISFAVALISLVLFHARWQNWAGGWCWGPRHLFIAHVFVMIPAAGFFAPTWNKARCAFFGAVLAAGATVGIYGCSQSFIDYYTIYFRTPTKVPYATVLYSQEDAATARFEMLYPDNQWRPFPLGLPVAPLNDSIYVPQNSQWYRYSEMWEMGYTDFMWHRLWLRAKGEEVPRG